jgi:DNA-binding XRE family transcriptional regulator
MTRDETPAAMQLAQAFKVLAELFIGGGKYDPSLPLVFTIGRLWGTRIEAVYCLNKFWLILSSR